MTDNELKKLAMMQAQFLAEELMSNKELLDKVFPPKYLDIKEAAEYLHIPVGTLYHKTGEIDHSEIGKRIIFSQRDLDEYAKRLRVKAGTSMRIVKADLKKVM